MGEKIKPVYKSDFELPGEGWHILRVEEPDVEPSKDSVKNFKVRAEVQGGEDDGKTAFDNFPLVSKKNFGISRLAGFLIKLGVLKEADEYDSDVFSSEKFEKKFKVEVAGKLYGGNIKHKTTTQGNKMANITEYATVKEAQEKMKEGGKTSTAPSNKVKGKGKEAPPPAEEEVDDDWVT